MSITLQSWIARSVEMALIGVESESSYIQTAEMLAEVLAPQVAQAVVRDAAGDPNRFQQTLQTVTLSFTDGVATLPSNVLTEYFSISYINDEADNDAALYTSWVKTFVDFRNRDTTLGAYTESPEGSLYYAPYGTSWEPGGADNFGGDLDLTIPCSITIPTNPATTIDVVAELEDALITTLASAIRGAEAWQAISTRTAPETT